MTPKERAAPSREAEAESRRTAPSREAAAESRRTAPTPAPVVRTQPEGETAGEGTVEERSAPQSAPASTSGRSRKSERGR